MTEVVVTKEQLLELIKTGQLKPSDLFTEAALKEDAVERGIKAKILAAKAEAVDKLGEAELGKEPNADGEKDEGGVSPYLDPKKNYMIPGSTAPTPAPKKEEVEDPGSKYTDPSQNKFIKTE
jgi:hypothetical protein